MIRSWQLIRSSLSTSSPNLSIHNKHNYDYYWDWRTKTFSCPDLETLGFPEPHHVSITRWSVPHVSMGNMVFLKTRCSNCLLFSEKKNRNSKITGLRGTRTMRTGPGGHPWATTSPDVTFLGESPSACGITQTLIGASQLERYENWCVGVGYPGKTWEVGNGYSRP